MEQKITIRQFYKAAAVIGLLASGTDWTMWTTKVAADIADYMVAEDEKEENNGTR